MFELEDVYNLHKGDKVYHPVHGEGTFIKLMDNFRESICYVEFDCGKKPVFIVDIKKVGGKGD
jgi:hypothetical protein